MEDRSGSGRVFGMAEPAAAFMRAGTGEAAYCPGHGPDGDSAAFALWRTRPEASAFSPLTPPPALILGPASFLFGILLIAPQAVFAAASLLGMGLVLSALAMRVSAACLARPVAGAPELPDTDLPRISVIVALHDEAPVLPGLMRSLSRLDYPRDRLQILLAIEADDHATLIAARAAARQHALAIVSVPPIGPRTKPKALNYALQHATGSLIAVYDAEDAPHPSQLRAAAHMLSHRSELACVQAPLGWYNTPENWLTRQFALEYAVQFHAIVPALARLGWPIPLGGTSNVFRRAALEAAGGWDPFNVTEDADLGFRLVRAGWRTGVIAPGTLEEAPVTRRAWTAQRSRWLKGHLVSWMVQMRDPRGLSRAGGLPAHAALHLTLGWNVVSALAHAPSVAVALALGAMSLGGAGPAYVLGALPAAYVCGMIVAALAARRAGIRVRAGDLLTMPVYWLLQAPAMWRALRELAISPYFWAKTTHGVSTARRKAPQ